MIRDMGDGIRRGLFIPFKWDIYKGSSLYFDILFRLHNWKWAGFVQLVASFKEFWVTHFHLFSERLFIVDLVSSNFDIQPHQVNNMRFRGKS